MENLLGFFFFFGDFCFGNFFPKEFTSLFFFFSVGIFSVFFFVFCFLKTSEKLGLKSSDVFFSIDSFWRNILARGKNALKSP